MEAGHSAKENVNYYEQFACSVDTTEIHIKQKHDVLAPNPSVLSKTEMIRLRKLIQLGRDVD